MIKFFNTLTRKKEQFVPIKDGTVSMYSCGPTVYKPAHIGNLRAYLFMDLLRRVLEYDGYKVKSVMNITDVGHLVSDADEGEDKMSKSAKEQQKDPLEIAHEITQRFFQDCASLNIKRPTVAPCATDNIKEMQKIVADLIEKGYAYVTDDGVYFDVASFPQYGKLSGIKLDEQKHGARVEVNENKRNPIDFALWKVAQPNHLQQWDSPWGRGFPGWHIECTAMGVKYLGERFDIHTGGVDHIPIHHENEIAQGECWLGHEVVNYWLHCEFLLIDGGKMSKSLGNEYTIKDLVDRGYSPLDYRYFSLNTSYSQKMNFTWEGISAASKAHERLKNGLYAHKQSNQPTDAKVLAKYKADFDNAIFDDLNAPLALGVVWTMLKEPKSKDIYNLALEMDKVLGLDIDKYQPQVAKVEAPDEIVQLAQQRFEARQNKDWAKSDQLRDQLASLGWVVKDKRDGFELEKI